jgi:outer membrane lipoprotein LolB
VDRLPIGAACRNAAMAALLLASCAPLPPVTEALAPTVADIVFTSEGRLSAKRGSDAVVANFEWTHTPLADVIALATPLGQTLARLEGSAQGASIVLADGRTATARSFDVLTDKTLGVPLPVSGLAWWIRGAPRPGGPFMAERDSRGRASVLRQDGWEIVYAYADDMATVPRRLVLAYPDVEVRVVVDTWR